MDPGTALRGRQKVGSLGKAAEAVVDETLGNLPAYRQQDRVRLQVSGAAPRREVPEAGTCRRSCVADGILGRTDYVAQGAAWSLANECRVHLLAAALEQVTPYDGSAWAVVRATDMPSERL